MRIAQVIHDKGRHFVQSTYVRGNQRTIQSLINMSMQYGQDIDD
jgi:hypothetical protein